MGEPIYPITMSILAVCVCAAIVWGMICLRTWSERAMALVCGALLMCGLHLAVLRAFEVPRQPWNVNRMAVTVSIVKGYSLYYPPDEGPIENHIYGPIAALAYLPVSVARTPTTLLLMAGMLAGMWFLVPCAMLIWRCSASSWIAKSAALAGFGLIVHSNFTLISASSWAHADAPAIGLCACAAMAIVWRNSDALVHETSRHRQLKSSAMLLSALCAVLAVWTKQTAAPIVVALPAWIALHHGRRDALRYGLFLLIIGLIVSASLLGVFGVRALWFNMFVEPSHHPWQSMDGSRMRALIGVLMQIARGCWFPATILVVAGTLSKPLSHDRHFFDRQWLLPLLIATAMIPTAMMGWVKQGGAENNGAYVTSFLLIAACAALADCERLRGLANHAYHGNQLLVGRAAVLAFIVYVAVQAYQNDPWLMARSRMAQKPHKNLAEIAYRYECAHPGKVYFPWDTLAPLLASGKLYHFDFGVHDRILAGFPPSPAHLKNHFPRGMRMIAVPIESPPTLDLLNLLPEFSQQKRLEELPGYIILQKPDSGN